jgi:hypothetical protein
MLEREEGKGEQTCYISSQDRNDHLAIGGQGQFADLHPRLWCGST